MNWKIYSEEKPKSFKQVIAYNPKWRGDKIIVGLQMTSMKLSK